MSPEELLKIFKTVRVGSWSFPGKIDMVAEDFKECSTGLVGIMANNAPENDPYPAGAP
ncbi:MAG: hypothetical protein ABSG28_05225 [Methanoregula sp.]|uniref:hypothetical protein n=1 Tax=Methanoregula sp. TaxID=2052170 RepID=UPI003C206BA3